MSFFQNHNPFRSFLGFTIFVLLSVPSFAAVLKTSKVTFTAHVNLPGVKVEGASAQARGMLGLNNTELGQLHVEIPPESLSTGLALRDRHMQEKIFQRPDGSHPNLILDANLVSCQSKACVVPAEISIRGKKHVQNLSFHITRKGAHTEVQVPMPLKLSDFGIEPPKYLGVGVNNEVAVEAVGTFE